MVVKLRMALFNIKTKLRISHQSEALSVDGLPEDVLYIVIYDNNNKFFPTQVHIDLNKLLK